jgi:hypothetical protein
MKSPAKKNLTSPPDPLEVKFSARADDKGIVNLDLMFSREVRVTVAAVTLKTRELYSSTAKRMASFKLDVTSATPQEIWDYKGNDLLGDKGPFNEKRLTAGTAYASGEFTDAADCVPPIDLDPCAPSYHPFGLVDDPDPKKGKPTTVNGYSFRLRGGLKGYDEPYAPGTPVSGTMVLIPE